MLDTMKEKNPVKYRNTNFQDTEIDTEMCYASRFLSKLLQKNEMEASYEEFRNENNLLQLIESYTLNQMIESGYDAERLKDSVNIFQNSTIRRRFCFALLCGGDIHEVKDNLGWLREENKKEGKQFSIGFKDNEVEEMFLILSKHHDSDFAKR